MKKISFQFGKEFSLITGGIATMKSLITIDTPEYKVQFIECQENDKMIPVSYLQEIKY